MTENDRGWRPELPPDPFRSNLKLGEENYRRGGPLGALVSPDYPGGDGMGGYGHEGRRGEQISSQPPSLSPPKITVARQRLMQDVYGNGSPGQGSGPPITSDPKWRPSMGQHQPAQDSDAKRRLIQEQRATLAAQVEENRRRKEAEKERERLEDEAFQSRLRAQEEQAEEKKRQDKVKQAREVAEQNLRAAALEEAKVLMKKGERVPRGGPGGGGADQQELRPNGVGNGSDSNIRGSPSQKRSGSTATPTLLSQAPQVQMRPPHGPSSASVDDTGHGDTQSAEHEDKYGGGAGEVNMTGKRELGVHRLSSQVFPAPSPSSSVAYSSPIRRHPHSMDVNYQSMASSQAYPPYWRPPFIPNPYPGYSGPPPPYAQYPPPPYPYSYDPYGPLRYPQPYGHYTNPAIMASNSNPLQSMQRQNSEAGLIEGVAHGLEGMDEEEYMRAWQRKYGLSSTLTSTPSIQQTREQSQASLSSFPGGDKRGGGRGGDLKRDVARGKAGAVASPYYRGDPPGIVRRGSFHDDSDVSIRPTSSFDPGEVSFVSESKLIPTTTSATVIDSIGREQAVSPVPTGSRSPRRNLLGNGNTDRRRPRSSGRFPSLPEEQRAGSDLDGWRETPSYLEKSLASDSVLMFDFEGSTRGGSGVGYDGSDGDLRRVGDGALERSPRSRLHARPGRYDVGPQHILCC